MSLYVSRYEPISIRKRGRKARGYESLRTFTLENVRILHVAAGFTPAFPYLREASSVKRDRPRRIQLQNITLPLDVPQNTLQFDHVRSNKSLSMREVMGSVGHKENERKVDCRERIPSVIAVLNNVSRLARACCVQLGSNLHDRMRDVSQMFVFFFVCQFVSIIGTPEYELRRRRLPGYQLSGLGGA